MNHTEIMQGLLDNGYGAWIVGGAVRDKLLGKEPKDYDLATDAVPERVIELFPGSKLINAAFSVATYVPCGDSFVEVLTLREESRYVNGRPRAYKFVKDINVDLARRDATINAMAMDIEGNIIDPYGGQSDLQSMIVRAVGDPSTRITEHPIRMMRYLRFSNCLGFKLDEKLESAIRRLSYSIRKEPWEAISMEFMKGMACDRPQMYVYSMKSMCLLDIIIPEISGLKGLKQGKYHKYDAWMHTLFAVSRCEGDNLCRLAVLLHDIGKPDTFKQTKKGPTFYLHEVEGAKIAYNICKRFRLSNTDTRLVCDAVRWHMHPVASRKNARKLLAKLGRENVQGIEFLMAVRKADKLAHNPSDLSIKDKVRKEEEVVREVLASSDAISIKDLAIDGRDVMDLLSIPSGALVGRVLNHLLDLVVSGKINNTREMLNDNAREYYINCKH